jgi:hypothetical protein
MLKLVCYRAVNPDKGLLWHGFGYEPVGLDGKQDYITA